MLRVGLTGGISAGKTTVGQYFAALGCHFTDSDSISHSLYAPGEAIHRAVVEAFGPAILAPDGTIDRRVLGEIVFRDSAKRQNLNNIVHPEIIRRQKEWLDQMETADPAGIGIVEAALMIEVGTYKNYDKLIVARCTEEDQIRRLMMRSNLNEEQACARISSQMPMEEKVKYADFVVNTSCSLEDVRHQVVAINSRLRELAAGTSDKRRS